MGDATKLLSLLALASGAVAMPQTSNADIIYTNLTSAPVQVGFSGADQFVIRSLPGGVLLGFFRTVHSGTFNTSNLVAVAGSNGGYVKVKRNPDGFAAVVPGKSQTGPVWSQIAGNTVGGATMARSSTFFGNQSPTTYTGQYLAFRFQDFTHGGRFTYGWVNVSLSFGGNGPDVTIRGYAYDNLGNPIRMGATVVPEPGSTAILALGALTLGAAGVRRWRRDRAAAGRQ